MSSGPKARVLQMRLRFRPSSTPLRAQLPTPGTAAGHFHRNCFGDDDDDNYGEEEADGGVMMRMMMMMMMIMMLMMTMIR